MRDVTRSNSARGLAISLTVVLLGTASAANWTREFVDQSGTGKFSSMKIDRAGNAHLVYVVDDQPQTLKYAFWDHVLKRWFTMKVASGASFPSLALDSKQHPAISWADAGTILGCKLHYTHWDGTSWKNETVPLAAETVAFYTSLALDRNDAPSMSFYEYNGPRGSGFRVRMRVATWTGKEWEVSTVDGQNQSGKFNSLAIDSKGHLHLAYANVNAGTAGTRYGFWDGESWHVEEVDGLGHHTFQYVGYGVFIVLDKDGDPHISYLNYSNPGGVKYAFRKGGQWKVQTVDQIARVGYPDRTALALDDQRRPIVAYYDASQGTVKVAHLDGSAWLTETVDGGGCGYTPSLQIHGDTVWLSYADEANRGIKVARAPLAEFFQNRLSRAPEKAPALSDHP